MPYYRGDAYGFRGDYYRGDPGLFSFLGKAIGGIAKVATGFVTGGPLGAVSSLFKPRGGAPAIVAPASFGPTMPGIYTNGGGVNGGGGSYGGSMMAIPTLTKGSLGPAGKRLHPNRSTYETRGGGTSRWPRALQLHEKGTVLVASRRRNVGNSRALRHALSRVAGFAHLARKVMSFVHPRAGRGHFKFPKRKRLKA
jgi:hypothetical protein